VPPASVYIPSSGVCTHTCTVHTCMCFVHKVHVCLFVCTWKSVSVCAGYCTSTSACDWMYTSVYTYMCVRAHVLVLAHTQQTM